MSVIHYLGSSITHARDDIPDVVARMGKLTFDSSARECLLLRKDLAGIHIRLEHLLEGDDQAEALAVRAKLEASPEYLNYCKVASALGVFNPNTTDARVMIRVVQALHRR
jgi:hypothetical protein